MVFIFFHDKYAEVENNLKESHQILMDNKYIFEDKMTNTNKL
jgi:hypothetical protein